MPGSFDHLQRHKYHRKLLEMDVIFGFANKIRYIIVHS